MFNAMILATSTEPSPDDVEKYASLIDKYGIMIVISAVFIIFAVLMFGVILKIVQSTFKQISSQQQTLMDRVMCADINKENPKIEKNILDLFLEIDEQIRNTLHDILKKNECDRLAVYVFHNGVFASHGLPFFKISCVSEVINKNCGITRKGKTHQNMPMNMFDTCIKTLHKDGRVVIHDIEDIKNLYPVLYNMLSESDVKSSLWVAIYDKDNNALGILMVEYADLKDDLDETLPKIVSDIKYLAPILEYSNYKNYCCK